MTIGEKIVKLRKEQNITQEQFAHMLNVSRQSVSKWELDTTYPDTEKLIKISKIFNCSLDYLLKDDIEQKDINLAVTNDEAKENKIRAEILTYLSFPPIFGWIVGILSLKFQKNYMRSKTLIALTICGMLFSLILTGVQSFLHGSCRNGVRRRYCGIRVRWIDPQRYHKLCKYG